MHQSRRHFIRPVLNSTELGSVNLLEIKRFLRQKNIEFKESHAALKILVPKYLLTKEQVPTEWKKVDKSLAAFYVNKTTGSFVCPELALVGKWPDLSNFLAVWCHNSTLKRSDPLTPLPNLKSLPLDNVLTTDSATKRLWDRAEPVESLDAVEFRSVLKAFKLPTRELKPEDFARYEARVVRINSSTVSSDQDGQDVDAEDDLSIANYELLFPVRYITGETVGLRRVYICPEQGVLQEENLVNSAVTEAQAAHDDVFPFPHGLDHAAQSHAQVVTVVASVLDSVVLSAKAPVGSVFPVALASGTSVLPPDHIPYFEAFAGGIVFWFPNDSASFEAVRTFSRKLGDHRCQTVRRDISQPMLWLRQKTGDVLNVLTKCTQQCCHEFITTFESLREEVFLEMMHHEEVAGVRWKRFDQLNELVGGFRRGELTVFSGRTGSGKTTFMSEYSLDLCMQNVSTLWGSFEVRNTRLARTQLKQFSAVNLEEHIGEFDKYADRFSKLPMYYLTFHGAEQVSRKTRNFF